MGSEMCIRDRYKEYHALGGNGTVTVLVNTIHELEVRDDKRPASQA